jgi:hypothetical protein
LKKESWDLLHLHAHWVQPVAVPIAWKLCKELHMEEPGRFLTRWLWSQAHHFQALIYIMLDMVWSWQQNLECGSFKLLVYLWSASSGHNNNSCGYSLFTFLILRKLEKFDLNHGRWIIWLDHQNLFLEPQNYRENLTRRQPHLERLTFKNNLMNKQCWYLAITTPPSNLLTLAKLQILAPVFIPCCLRFLNIFLCHTGGGMSSKVKAAEMSEPILSCKNPWLGHTSLVKLTILLHLQLLL